MHDTERIPRPQNLPAWAILTDEEKIDAVAEWVLETYRDAFEELAK